MDTSAFQPATAPAAVVQAAVVQVVKHNWWLELAERIDSLRLAPRIVLFGCGSLLGWFVVYSTVHYFHLPGADRTLNVTGFISTMTAFLGVVAGYAYKIYAPGGRNWDDPDRDGPPGPQPH